MTSRALRLRRPATCGTCRGELPAGIVVQWDPACRTITCRRCLGGPGGRQPWPHLERRAQDADGAAAASAAPAPHDRLGASPA